MDTQRPPSLEGFLHSLLERNHPAATIKIERSERSGAIILTIGASRDDASEEARYSVTGNAAMPLSPERS